jgi:DnaJ-class molecular chaperone
MKNKLIIECIALLNTANFQETLNEKRDNIVNKLKEELAIQRVVQPNLTDKNSIKGVNQNMQTDNNLDDIQLFCELCDGSGGNDRYTTPEECHICQGTGIAN